MSSTDHPSSTITMRVPFRVVKRGGRTVMQLPDVAGIQRPPDSTLVKALARAFRWKRMLDRGEFATIAELAKRERIAPSYLTRILQLTLLAPDIIELILDGEQNTEVKVELLRGRVPDRWAKQRKMLTG